MNVPHIELMQCLSVLVAVDFLRELGLLSLEKRRLQEHPITAFQYLEGPTRKLERDF